MEVIKINPMIRKCCFNCDICFPATDNKFECRNVVGKIVKSMKQETVIKEVCDKFRCNCYGADPYE